LSLYLNITLNPVIGEPPESGIDQLTITLSGTQVVVGAGNGRSGICAARIETVFEKVL